MGIENEALALATVDARLALRRRDYPAVERIVRQSRALTQSVEVDNVQADEILAESYLDQGRYDDALGQIVRYRNNATDRLAMTLAAVYLGQGRNDLALSVLRRSYGVGERPGLTVRQRLARSQIRVRELPADRDPSDAALAASVWLLRGAAFAFVQSGPETMADLEGALRLAPNDGQIRLAIARRFVESDPARARSEAQKAFDLGSAEVRRAAREAINRSVHSAEAQEAKAHGTRVP